MTTQASGRSDSRRGDALGVHSIGEFVLAVPSLQDAEHFYSAFGLAVSGSGEGLALGTSGDGYPWGRVIEARRKGLQHVTFHCHEEDVDRFRTRLNERRVAVSRPPPGADGNGLWFLDQDELLIEVRSGPKTMPGNISPIDAIDGSEGKRRAPYRRNTGRPAPRRLSHILRFTPNVDRAIDFYTQVLGLRLSDRSGDGIAFLHGIHGSDHHMMAFVKSEHPGLHHLSWDVPSVDAVGLGAATMADKGYAKGWGVGRHVLGSNYFYYVRDPWGSYCEYSCGIDYIPASANWQSLDHPAEDSFYLWGPDVPPEFVVNCEAMQD